MLSTNSRKKFKVADYKERSTSLNEKAPTFDLLGQQVPPHLMAEMQLEAIRLRSAHPKWSAEKLTRKIAEKFKIHVVNIKKAGIDDSGSGAAGNSEI